MALHFGKRETEQPKTLNSGMATQRYGVGSNSSSPVTPQATTASEPTPTPTPSTPPARTSVVTPEGGSKLTVGPNIKLKGVEITDCDTLVVEGLVEATMDSRVIQISEQGAFRGSADIDIAEIRGDFNGTLTVRQKLVIFSTGKVSGKIRYGKLVIEEGGQISGEVDVGAASSACATSGVSGPKWAPR